MRVDTFPFFNELDILECRLTEIYDAVDYFVAVEADVDHQGNPKPYWLSENLDRFDPFKDKLRVVRATGLPPVDEFPNAWWREQAQREHAIEALKELRVGNDDIILHGDVDEIPTVVAARNVQPRGYVTFLQRAHFWALDWVYPPGWEGTAAARVRDIPSFADLRNSRRRNRQQLPNAGWHISWMGGAEANITKVEAFCHPEIGPALRESVANGHTILTNGRHTDGTILEPVDVDDTYPKWIRDGNAPASWYRPR
jgi:beta-1,4-mannosyl-glycoprotein beta-1,4-N-acetylglucosaminyltransferase